MKRSITLLFAVIFGLSFVIDGSASAPKDRAVTTNAAAASGAGNYQRRHRRHRGVLRATGHGTKKVLRKTGHGTKKVLHKTKEIVY
jgi:hypothetical protein